MATGSANNGFKKPFVSGRNDCELSEAFDTCGVKPEYVKTVGDNECWFLCAQVCGAFVEWLVDCGSNPNLLSVDVFNQIPEAQRPAVQPADLVLYSANDQRIATFGQVKIDLELEGAVFSRSGCACVSVCMGGCTCKWQWACGIQWV